MQENNFEKNMQQRMEELQLNPSGDVWLHVEATLKKKKDRKAILLLLLVLFFGCIGAWIFVANHKPAKMVMAQNIEGKDSTAAVKTITTSSLPAIAKDTIESLPVKDKVQQNKTENTDINTAKKLATGNQQQTLVTAGETANPSVATTGTYKTALVKKHRNQFKTPGKASVQVTAALVETTDETAADNYPEKQQADFYKIDLSNKKTLTGATLNQLLLTVPTPENAVAVNTTDTVKSRIEKKISSSKSRKVSLIFSFAAGSTATAKKYLGAVPNSDYYNGSLPANSSTGGIFVPDSLLPVNRNPASVKTGFGFNAALLLKKNISSRTSISAGLQYQFFTTSITTGEMVQPTANTSTFDAVYKPGAANKYTNYYHLIQLPVELSSQLSRFKKHNIILEGGLSISQLLYTNTLQFDNASRRYFKDNSYFNKTVVGFSAGLSVNLLSNNNKSPLLLGPQFYYSLTPLAGKGLYDNSHYSFLGLRLQKTVGKK